METRTRAALFSLVFPVLRVFWHGSTQLISSRCCRLLRSSAKLDRRLHDFFFVASTLPTLRGCKQRRPPSLGLQATFTGLPTVRVRQCRLQSGRILAVDNTHWSTPTILDKQQCFPSRHFRCCNPVYLTINKVPEVTMENSRQLAQEPSERPRATPLWYGHADETLLTSGSLPGRTVPRGGV